MELKLILSCFLAILALVNPIQKVLIVTSLQDRFSPTELRYISVKSTITAMLILIFFIYLGQLTFSYVFRVELYSFQITCGAVLMYNGLSGLLKGFFMKVDEHIKIADLTTVPIAIPMIAGPATITAAVTFPVQYSRFVTIIAIFLALAVNLFFMLKARQIGRFLIKYNFMNPLIRIIGLIVATIGLQMMLDGIALFVKTLSA
ncbi:MAG: MarC family protein [Odoribacter sp.]